MQRESLAWRRIIRGLIVTISGIIVLSVLGITITWSHWWWPDWSARVWIDGRLAPEDRVFRGADGRRLLFYPNHDKDWYVQTVIVSGYKGGLDQVAAVAPVGMMRGGADAIVLPFGVFCKTAPPVTEEVSHDSDDLDPKVQRLPDGYRFLGWRDSLIAIGRSRVIEYRLKY